MYVDLEFTFYKKTYMQKISLEWLPTQDMGWR